MGIEDRDYYREASRKMGGVSGGMGMGWPPVVKWILIINIVVYLLQIFITRGPDVAALEEQIRELPAAEQPTREELEAFVSSMPRQSVVQEWFELDTDKVLHGQVWRLLTAAFCHAREDLFHILFNMLFLVWFGITLERMYRSAEFLRFYLTAALVASLAHIALDLITGDRSPAIGASGAVMGVVMLYATHFPRQKIYIWAIIPIEIRWIVLFYVLFDLHPVLLALAGDKSYDGIAHAAHLGGLAFGFLYRRFKWNLEGLYTLGGRIGMNVGDGKSGGGSKGKASRRPAKKKPATKKRKPKANPKIRVARADPLEDKVDELLQKISDKGASSLTEEEKKFLERASKQYRDRDDR